MGGGSRGEGGLTQSLKEPAAPGAAAAQGHWGTAQTTGPAQDLKHALEGWEPPAYVPGPQAPHQRSGVCVQGAQPRLRPSRGRAGPRSPGRDASGQPTCLGVGRPPAVSASITGPRDLPAASECPVGQSLFMFVSPFLVVSVTTADRWARVDGFFNLLPIKRLYFDYFMALLWCVRFWCDNYWRNSYRPAAGQGGGRDTRGPALPTEPGALPPPLPVSRLSRPGMRSFLSSRVWRRSRGPQTCCLESGMLTSQEGGPASRHREA